MTAILAILFILFTIFCAFMAGWTSHKIYNDRTQYRNTKENREKEIKNFINGKLP